MTTLRTTIWRILRFLRIFVPKFIIKSEFGKRMIFFLRFHFGGQPLIAADLYKKLYETHGSNLSSVESIGSPDSGHYDLVGAIELGILTMEGLSPSHTVFDFGCGTGRLAVHLVPVLPKGEYIGSDISQSIISHAAKLIDNRYPATTCKVRLINQETDKFPLSDSTVDIICAFSVFTHMEHEDMYRYLKDAFRITKSGGKFIFSCLPMNLGDARQIFLDSANMPINHRWSIVRNVTTSKDFMNEISRLAGWNVLKWYEGNEANIIIAGQETKYALGQSTCVLEKNI